jgi:hypothetical protein
MRYAFQGLTLNEFNYNWGLSQNGAYITELGFQTLNKTDCAVLLVMWVVFYAVIFLLALKYINFEER